MAQRKNHHPQRDFFIADIFDNMGISFKDDLASMEHPVFVLSKKKDMRNIEYHKGNVSITIKPNADGLPTIFDKDILLYCGSLLMAEINEGRIPPKTLRISAHDLLVTTNRPTDGRGYILLKQAFDRLKGVTVKTNIKTGKREQISAFGLIESYDIIESSRVKNRMIRLEVTLSDWYYNSIVGKEVLTLNRDYFLLGKPLERRLYEIARKHCGNQQSWSIGLTSLLEKSGSTSPLRKFRYFVKQIADDNHIPDYSLTLIDDDLVTFTNRTSEPKQEAQQSLQFDAPPAISHATLDKARLMTHQAGTGWDFDYLHQEFTTSLLKGFAPNNVNGAFINFVKKKISKRPS